MSLVKLKWAAIASFVVGMVILLAGGLASRDELPPYPGKVHGAGGEVLFQRSDILEGQDVY